MDSARKLNPDAFDAVGNLKSLLEQYGEVQLRRELDPTFRMPHPFIVAVDGGITGVDKLSGLPIVLTARSLRHIVNKHDASVAVLNHLAEELMGNVLVFEHGENPDKMTFVLDRNTNGGNELIVVVHADMLINRVEVAAVRSCHGKDVEASRVRRGGSGLGARGLREQKDRCLAGRPEAYARHVGTRQEGPGAPVRNLL